MPLSWNEIKNRAVSFSKRWSEARRERAEAQTFWNEFFDIFGISRRKVASFEEPVRNLSGDTEFIDLFWKGRLIAEHKSRGGNLGKAHTQAAGYVQNLINEGRGEEVPQYILVSDFARFALHDLEATEPQNQTIDFHLAALPGNIRAFAFIAGYQTRRLDPEDPANFDAVALLGNLHDRLEEGGYTGHALERFLVRILFCLFADDTGIFEPDTFKFYLDDRTRPDGSDLGAQLARFFGILNTPRDRRQRNLDDDLANLPYVNGELFSEDLGFAEFNAAMRTALVSCCTFHWDRISPAIFGSLFQAVMQPRERRQIGAHYTSERDILKLINSLFLDDLRTELRAARASKPKLRELHDKIAAIKFLDPACGCGNFLVVTYRELRRLEIAILRELYGDELSEGDLRAECRVDVDQMYGIEIEEWPARIAEVAMWLMDHQMNNEVFDAFGKSLVRLPLTKSAKITVNNALRIDWRGIVAPGECSYILGNPPFVGKKARNAMQTEDMDLVFGKIKGAGVLDYVCCWYLRAAEYIEGYGVRVAFVSTNSITQGEQPGVLWNALFGDHALKVHFAHRTFAWESEARGMAHVHVVIIGFGQSNAPDKRIYDYEMDPNHPTLTPARNISPYLVEGGDMALRNRTTPISNVPEIQFGNMPNDDGNLLLTDSEKESITVGDRRITKYLRPFISAKEYLHGETRWCLWLVDAPPSDLNGIPEIRRRAEAVQAYRSQSTRKTTRELARYPSVFGEIRQPTTRYVLFPRHTSEQRPYIPISYFSPRHIVADSCLFVANASLYHFGVLSSLMHMAWVRQVCGRIKSDYRYSNNLVYNNYPWPEDVSEKQRERVERCAQGVLDARAAFPNSMLADLYDPVAMPPRLVKAHADLDRAVDRCYRAQPFTSERLRIEYLFALYERLIAPLTTPVRAPRRRTRTTPESE
jgi:type I restriction-modification system DNA methylase subunit